MFDFQEEVIRVAGEEALELGLLFGTENLTPQEEETDVLCFAHLLIQEFVAGYFVSKFDKVCLAHVLVHLSLKHNFPSAQQINL